MKLRVEFRFLCYLSLRFYSYCCSRVLPLPSENSNTARQLNRQFLFSACFRNGFFTSYCFDRSLQAAYSSAKMKVLLSLEVVLLPEILDELSGGRYTTVRLVPIP